MVTEIHSERDFEREVVEKKGFEVDKILGNKEK